MHKLFAVHAGSRTLQGVDSHWRHTSERFFPSSRPEYLHPVCSELENSGIRVAIGDCSVTEHRHWRPLYQTSKTVHVHANTLQTWRGWMPGVHSHGSVPLSHSGNSITRTGLHFNNVLVY